MNKSLEAATTMIHTQVEKTTSDAPSHHGIHVGPKVEVLWSPGKGQFGSLGMGGTNDS